LRFAPPSFFRVLAYRAGAMIGLLKPLGVMSMLVCRTAFVDAQGEEDAEQDFLSAEQLRVLHGKMDTNSDGKVSMDEIMAFSDEIRKVTSGKDVGSILTELDRDKDGKISLEELMKDLEAYPDDDKVSQEQRVEVERAKFQAADKNGDGILDATETVSFIFPETDAKVLDVATRGALKQKDLDHDGKLSPKEFWVIEEEISPEEHTDFKQLDTDGDGALSVEELKHWESGRFHTKEAMMKIFELADKNGDSHISAEELHHSREALAGSDAHYHFSEWAEHHEL